MRKLAVTIALIAMCFAVPKGFMLYNEHQLRSALTEAGYDPSEFAMRTASWPPFVPIARAVMTTPAGDRCSLGFQLSQRKLVLVTITEPRERPFTPTAVEEVLTSQSC